MTTIPVASVSQLFIYPVKGMKGISLQTADVLPKGLQYDRRWMLIDDNYQFISQRTVAKLALCSTAIRDNYLQLSFDNQMLEVPLSITGNTFAANIWNDIVDVIPANTEVNKLISSWLGQSCRLVFFPEQNERAVDIIYAKIGDQTSLSDGYPILLLSEASIHDLNSRIHETIPIDRFRPNIVVEGCQPYAEDSWAQLSISGINMRVVKPCKRCIVTTINQQTGIAAAEPLKTLATYRLSGNKVIFGMNIIPDEKGTISVGDFVFVED